MTNFEKICNNLIIMEGIRQPIIEEYGYETPYYPPDATYGDTMVSSPETISVYDSLPFPVRKNIGVLLQNKKPNQSIVYSPDRKQALLIPTDELQDYVDHGYDVLYEETTVGNVSGVDQPYADTSGKFNQVSGKNPPLFRGSRQLSSFRGRKFSLPSGVFKRLKKGKRKFKRYDEAAPEDLKKFSKRKGNEPVVIEDDKTGELAFFRRRNNDGRLKHNRSK